MQNTQTSKTIQMYVGHRQQHNNSICELTLVHF